MRGSSGGGGGLLRAPRVIAGVCGWSCRVSMYWSQRRLLPLEFYCAVGRCRRGFSACGGPLRLVDCVYYIDLREK